MLSSVPTSATRHVHFGCGLCVPATWTNFDASLTPRLLRIPVFGGVLAGRLAPFPPSVRFGDVVKGLPVEPGSCAAVYSSHTLEHLTLADCRRALRNTFSYLAPGGVFRLVVPDLETLVRTYTAATHDDAASDFLRESYLGTREHPRGMEARLRWWLGHSRHFWMWDYKGMRAELAAAGFVAIRRASYGDAEDAAFKDVEDASRWVDAVGIECRRAA